MPTVQERRPRTQREFAEIPVAEADDIRSLALLDRAENCAWSRYRRELLGPKLVWLEGRLFCRLFRYRDELIRLNESAPESWSPRVRFMFEDEAAWYALPECHDPACDVPRWPQENLISVINRRDDAIATSTAKLELVALHLDKIQKVFWTRHREIERLKHETALLRQVLAPQRRRGWR